LATKQFILGTAGHIDHGKTALVKLLTGSDCDRLPEEKARGITIELGFASLDLRDKSHIGIVDVPGHERFVRNMVAGASGIDIIMLVIAADEGVMPQTREHFEICRMLGVKVGFVALTKSDLVDDDWIELVKSDIEDFVQGSFLEGAPIVAVSSKTGAGKDDIIEAIENCSRQVQQKSAVDMLRLPVDRVFTMKGFGTVVTGTLNSGRIRVGDEIEALPAKKRTRVRGIQVHDLPVEESTAGLRTAVNLQSLGKDEIHRGDVFVVPGSVEPTYMLDARLEVLRDAAHPVEMRTRVRFHVHTSEIPARVYPMSADEIAPGERGIIQLRLEQPAVVLPGDRFVLRSFSMLVTIGGGVIVHPKAAKHRRPYDDVLKDLRVLETGELSGRMRVLYARAGYEGLSFASLRGLLGASGKELHSVYQKLLSAGRIIRFDPDGERSIGAEPFQQVLDAAQKELEAHHESSPESPGLTRGELAAKTRYGLGFRLAAKVISHLEKSRAIEVDGDIVRMAGHRPGFKGQMAAMTMLAKNALKEAGFSPPTTNELVEKIGARKEDSQRILDHLVQSGDAVRIGPALYYDREMLDELIAMTEKRLEEAGEMDAQAMKALTGLSRKFVIPLMEYFDGIKLTLRVGDKRIARKKSQ
jgi:selenocysteine-specific elongation factor